VSRGTNLRPKGDGRRRRGRNPQTSLWVAPVVGAIVALLVAAAALTVDQFIDWRDAPPPIFVGDPDTARTLLSVIAGAVATLLALIFTVIAVVIQLAIGHYTPRALSLLLGDRPTHFTIGVFVGTFTYALVVLLYLPLLVTDDGVVSGLSMTLAFALAVIAIATFAVFSNHIIHSVRATSLIHRIAAETRATIDALYAPFSEETEVKHSSTAAPSGAPRQLLGAPKPGVLVDVDEMALLEQAVAADGVLAIRQPVGAFVPEGAPLLAIHGGTVDVERALSAIELAGDRDLRLDASFGVRQLMDIAARALSSGVNDPATAVQVLDELHDLLRRLTQRSLSDGRYYDSGGRLRVLLRIVEWEEVVVLSLDDMRRLGLGSMAVMRRLRAVIEDLLTVAPPSRRASLEQQLLLLDQAAESSFATEFERKLARQADVRGTGF
jgi:uncharacterized membrane protein